MTSMLFERAAPARALSGLEASRRLPLPARIAIPFGIAALLLILWEAAVKIYAVPKVILPPPSMIARVLVADWAILLPSLVNTAVVTYEAFAIALVLGIAVSVAFARSPIVETSLSPFAVVLQVTPVVAIAPLILVWVGLDHVDRALLILAAIVGFFPILSSTTLGLKSADHNLRELLALSRASSFDRLIYLELPGALPFLLTGMKIAIGLALIGSVVAEFVAGSGTATGIAWRIVEAANRLNSARMFAALVLLTGFGVFNFLVLSAIQHLLLHEWHESTFRKE